MNYKHISARRYREMNKAYKAVVNSLNDGAPLNLKMIGDIFGQEFWMLQVLVQTNLTLNDAPNIKFNIIIPEGK